MIFQALGLNGAWLICPEPQVDARGHFARLFCVREFAEHGLHGDFSQHSISYNKQKGTLRGLHYQSPPLAETKLVRCTRGRIFDVIVDIRQDSPGYGNWIGYELTPENGRAIYIPTGFAHGFITLEDHTEVYYLINPEYRPGYSRAIAWNDETLGIKWPIEPTVMSEQDRTAPALNDL